MHYKSFLEILPKVLKEKLPGELAHNIMSPPERLNLLQEIDLKNMIPKEAAVMMLFYPKNQHTHLVLIKRATYNGVHSSQISFPGGKVEVTDIDYSLTAKRETFEEIGILPKNINIIRSFSNIYVPPSNFMVYPFLAIANEELHFVLDSREVEKVIEIPLNLIMDESIIVNKIMNTSYSKEVIVPTFKIYNYHVWGATAMILSELKEVFKRHI